MKKIRLLLEYKCYPIWIYKDNELIDNGLPEKVIGDTKIYHLCDVLQKEFDNLYKDDESEFKYIGFNDFKVKEKFKNNIQSLERILKKKLGGDYEVINDININEL